MEAGIACNCSSSFGMSNASTNSSESRNKIQSLAAFCIAKFRAAEKSSHHTKSYTHGVTAEAIFLELSEEPVSTTTISQPRALIRSRHIFKLSHSFFVMMQIDRFGMFCTLRLNDSFIMDGIAGGVKHNRAFGILFDTCMENDRF